MGRYWRVILILCVLLAIPSNASASSFKWADDPFDWPDEIVDAVHYTVNKYGTFLNRDSYYAISYLGQSKTDQYTWYATLLELDPNCDPSNWGFMQDGLADYQLTITHTDVGFTAQFDNMPSRNPARAFVETKRDQVETTLMQRSVLAETPIMPWLKGTYAYYGLLGLHLYDAYGSNSYPGWYAVDFIGGPFMGETGMPNAVYASTSGQITVLCTDDTQMGIRIGIYQYLHLVPTTDLYTGKVVNQGNYLGTLITGDSDTNCGYTDQLEDNYHLHFGFKPVWPMRFENYSLTYETFMDVHEGTLYEPGDNLYAEWLSDVDPDILPPGLPDDYNIGVYHGDSLWDGLVNGVVFAAINFANRLFPSAADLLPTMQILSIAAISIALIYMVALVNFTFPLAVFSTISLLEIVRLGKAIWQQIKSIFI